MDAIRPCERLCSRCKQWLHFSRFCRRLRKIPDGSIWDFDHDCKACQQVERNKQKNLDRARSIIENRAATRAREIGVSKPFMLVDMNWNSLVPQMRVLMTDEGRCVSCGHAFRNERDIQIEHREPPRFRGDLARESARNIGFLCQSCNVTKQNKAHSEWLDDQEAARLSNTESRLFAVMDSDTDPFLPFGEL